MRGQWFGQSAFSLTGAERTVFVDPFGRTPRVSAATDADPIVVVPAVP